MRKCRVCGAVLSDDNWYASGQKKNDYICKNCSSERRKLWTKANPEKARAAGRAWEEANPDKVKASTARTNRKRGHLPFDENKECSQFLGIHVAERVLRHIFNDVKMMPMHNRGYDFVCNRNKKIDAKSSCTRKNRNRWTFTINHNTIADYFLCLAFDNREDLNPLYIWLLPGDKVNHLSAASISKSTIDTWNEYRLDIDNVSACCDVMRGD